MDVELQILKCLKRNTLSTVSIQAIDIKLWRC